MSAYIEAKCGFTRRISKTPHNRNLTSCISNSLTFCRISYCYHPKYRRHECLCFMYGCVCNSLFIFSKINIYVYVFDVHLLKVIGNYTNYFRAIL